MKKHLLNSRKYLYNETCHRLREQQGGILTQNQVNNMRIFLENTGKGEKHLMEWNKQFCVILEV